MNRLLMVIATGFYIGNIPKAPGTWGSVVGLLLWLTFKDVALLLYLGIVAASFVIGFFAAGAAEKILDRPDAGPIVIDEIVGMFITLTLAPPHPAAWLLGLALFRLFDITKPFPVSWFDKHIHGGIGIMMDDVMAGVYALISLQILWFFFGAIF